MIKQVSFHLSAKRRGCHLVTSEVLGHLPKPLPQTGLHQIMNRLVKENEPYYNHTMEGLDDMPAHAKCSLFGVSLTIPITNGRLNLGTWQGIYLCEFRDYGGERRIVATIYE